MCLVFCGKDMKKTTLRRLGKDSVGELMMSLCFLQKEQGDGVNLLLRDYSRE